MVIACVKQGSVPRVRGPGGMACVKQGNVPRVRVTW